MDVRQARQTTVQTIPHASPASQLVDRPAQNSAYAASINRLCIAGCSIPSKLSVRAALRRGDERRSVGVRRLGRIFDRRASEDGLRDSIGREASGDQERCRAAVTPVTPVTKAGARACGAVELWSCGKDWGRQSSGCGVTQAYRWVGIGSYASCLFRPTFPLRFNPVLPRFRFWACSGAEVLHASCAIAIRVLFVSDV